MKMERGGNVALHLGVRVHSSIKVTSQVDRVDKGGFEPWPALVTALRK